MGRGVDGHRLIDAMAREWVFRRNFPATVLLDQGQPVWRIAVDLVGAAENERCVRAMLTSCLEQRECAVGIDGKIDDGIPRRPVMRRLCRCMDYNGNVTAILAEYILDCGLIANVGIIVPVTRQIGLKRCALPARAGVIPKEQPAHIIVNSDDI